MTEELRDSAHDRIRTDFGALMDTIRDLRDLAENRQDAKLNSIAFDLKMYACRLADTATLKMYIEDCDELRPIRHFDWIVRLWRRLVG